MLMAAKFGMPVCPHAGGVGLCEYVAAPVDVRLHRGRRDRSTDRVIEYVDHLHEHFVDPVRGRAADAISRRPSRATASRSAPSPWPSSHFPTGRAGGRTEEVSPRDHCQRTRPTVREEEDDEGSRVGRARTRSGSPACSRRHRLPPGAMHREGQHQDRRLARRLQHGFLELVRRVREGRRAEIRRVARRADLVQRRRGQAGDADPDADRPGRERADRQPCRQRRDRADARLRGEQAHPRRERGRRPDEGQGLHDRPGRQLPLRQERVQVHRLARQRARARRDARGRPRLDQRARPQERVPEAA